MGEFIITLSSTHLDPYFPSMASKLPLVEMEHVKRLRDDSSMLSTLCSGGADPSEIIAVLKRMTGDATYLQQYYERHTPPPTPRISKSSPKVHSKSPGQTEKFDFTVASKEQFMKTFDLSEQDYGDVTVTIILELALITRMSRSTT
jgi:hypothetical protein